MFRYATVSVISTVVSFSILGLLFGVFRLWSEVPTPSSPTWWRAFPPIT